MQIYAINYELFFHPYTFLSNASTREIQRAHSILIYIINNERHGQDATPLNHKIPS